MVSELRSRILNYLRESREPVATRDLASNLRRKTKELNQVLYPLLRQGVVSKVQETPPLWKFNGKVM